MKGASSRMKRITYYFGRILEETPERVVPCTIKGMWGSYFSHHIAKPFRKPFKRGLWNQVHVQIGEPVNPDEASSESLEQIISKMVEDSNE